MRIGVVSKKGSDVSYRVSRDILCYGSEVLGLEMLADKEIANDIGWDRVFYADRDRVDFLIVVGGDGTLLRAFQRLKFIETPIVGVRTGRRGFLLDVEPSEVLSRLRDLVEGRYSVYEYMLLKITTVNGGEYYSLNDLVIANVRDTRSGVISLEISVDGDLLYRFDGDGVIVSTPLGSTAYTFSVGGPVVDVDLEAITVAPLAPLQTYAKPVVLSSRRTVEVVNISEADTALCIVDGGIRSKLQPSEKVVIKKSERGAKIVRFRKFNTLKRVQVCEF